MSLTTIYFPDCRIPFVEKITRQRMREKPTKPIGGQSLWDTEFWGVLGEVAVNDYYWGLDTDIHGEGKDDGWDLVIQDWRIGVKCSIHTTAEWLLLKHGKPFTADLEFFSHRAGKQAVKIVGWSDKPLWMSKKETIDLGRGPTQGLHKRHLNRWNPLRDLRGREKWKKTSRRRKKEK